MSINCVPLLVYLFSCRFRKFDDDFVFNKTNYSNHLLLIYTPSLLEIKHSTDTERFVLYIQIEIWESYLIT